MSSIRTSHTMVLQIIENIWVSLTIYTTVWWFIIKWLIWSTYWFISWTGHLILYIFKVSIIINFLLSIEVCLEFLTLCRIQTLTRIFIKVKTIFTWFAFIFLEIPIFRKIAWFTLLAVKIPFFGRTLRILRFICWNFSNKVLSIHHVAVEKFSTNESILLALFLRGRKWITFFTDLTLAWLEIKVSWKITT